MQLKPLVIEDAVVRFQPSWVYNESADRIHSFISLRDARAFFKRYKSRGRPGTLSLELDGKVVEERIVG